jgi:hypothetical protein
MEYIQTVFIPRLEGMYPSETPQPVPQRNQRETLVKSQLKIQKLLASLYANLGVLGLSVLFIFLVFFLPGSRSNNLPAELELQQNQGISACFCQQAWEKVPEVSASEVQLQACEARYICLGNAKASCLLQAERQWDSCEF